MANLEDILLTRQARLSRWLAGLALAWPDEVMAVLPDPGLITDATARAFIERLREAGAMSADQAILAAGEDAARLAIWLVEAGAAMDFCKDAAQKMVRELCANWTAIRVLGSLQKEIVRNEKLVSAG